MMKLNPKIQEVLEAFSIDIADGTSYLLSIYFDCRPSYTPPILVQKINLTNILYFNGKELLWLVPLFESMNQSEIILDKWGWVDEWRTMFEVKNSARKGPKSTVVARMKTFFAANPEVRKDDIIGATKMYLNQVDSAFVTSSHYFITKGHGTQKVSLLEEWLEKYEKIKVELDLPPSGVFDLTSEMQ